MDRKTAVLLVLLFASLFLVVIRISMDFPQGLGIYNGSTSATNPEGTIRFKVATQIQVILIDPPDNTVYTIPGTSLDVNLTCQANNLTTGINITQIRLYTNITGVFAITETINTSGSPPYNATFILLGVPLGSYRWNCEAVSNIGNMFAPSDWHFTIRTTVPPPTPGGGGGGRWPPTKVKEEAVIPPPPIIIEIPMPLPPPPEPNIIHEFTQPADLSAKQSWTNLRIKVPTAEDAETLRKWAEGDNLIRIRMDARTDIALSNTMIKAKTEDETKILRAWLSEENIVSLMPGAGLDWAFYTINNDLTRFRTWASEENMIRIVSEAEPLPEYSDEWDLLSTVSMWKLKIGEWQDFPLIAENKMLDYKPVNSMRFSTTNNIPIRVITNATGEESGRNITFRSIADMPVGSPPYFVKFTDVVDGYVGVYFVLDGYHFSTNGNEFILDFELSLDNDLILGDILSSAKLYPNEYNIIYKRYKLPDLPKKAVYSLTSRVYEKGPKLVNIAATYRSNIDFRKETPTQMGKTIIS